jgi:hypothetical protein
MTGVLTNMTTQRNPGFFNFVGGDGQVTVAEKRASDRGVAARGTSGVTSGRDRCKRGKACGATCIAGNEDCILDFPEPVQAQLQKMAQFVLNRRAKEGRVVEAGSENDIELGRAIGDVGRHLTKEGTYQRGSGKYTKETQERAFGTTQFGLQRMLGNKEIDNLRTNRDRIVGSEDDAMLRRAWQRDTQSRGVRLSRKDLEHVYDSLDMAAKDQLNGTGSPPKGQYYGGKDKNGKEITNAQSANKERGLAVLDLYLRQGGTDAYQIGSTRVFSPADLDIEHVKPMQAKRGSGQGGKDEPENWVLARAGAQRTRSDQFFKDFIDNLPDTKNKQAMAEYYSTERKARQASRAMAALSQDIYKNRNRYSDEEFLKMVKLQKAPAKKSGEITVNPIAKKVFLNEQGKQDGFFVGAVLKDPTGTARSGQVPQPAGWAKAYLLARKNESSPAEAAALRSQIREIWQNQWLGGRISTQQMVNQVANVYQNKLSPKAWSLVKDEVAAAGQSLVNKYPNVGTPSAKKDVESAIDDLLKSL